MVQSEMEPLKCVVRQYSTSCLSSSSSSSPPANPTQVFSEYFIHHFIIHDFMRNDYQLVLKNIYFLGQVRLFQKFILGKQSEMTI